MEEIGWEEIGRRDTERVDTGEVDTTEVDTGEVDTSEMDTGRVETGRGNSGGLDTRWVDTEVLDTGRVDTGRLETGRRDTGEVDTGRVDAGGVHLSWLASEGVNTGDVATRETGGPKMQRSGVASREWVGGILTKGGFALSGPGVKFLTGRGGGLCEPVEHDEARATDMGGCVVVALCGAESCTNVWPGCCERLLPDEQARPVEGCSVKGGAPGSGTWLSVSSSAEGCSKGDCSRDSLRKNCVLYTYKTTMLSLKGIQIEEVRL